jgi:hypothetical protein
MIAFGRGWGGRLRSISMCDASKEQEYREESERRALLPPSKQDAILTWLRVILGFPKSWKVDR